MARLALILLLLLLSACGQEDQPKAVAVSFAPQPLQSKTVDFNSDVRPILSGACFRCHGPDAAARKRGLRLDTRDGATSLLKNGTRAVAPGDPDASELLRRITSDDPDEVMPPPEVHIELSAAQKDTLAQWIRSGAEYQPHWAFVPPHAVRSPTASAVARNLDPIDRFVVDRLASEGMRPSPGADRATLLRRAALTLTGMPPTPEETTAFVADPDPDAYSRQVDRLLASPRYGERMAADWLDVARFADTFGYQSDWECRVWPWRDWLISSFNSNQPYDQFVRDQLAGDLLPGATAEQRLATTFNRLHRQTNEGGSIDEEFRREYISDRVHTYGTAFLGLTVECARCHDHKYDPIPQRDYYSLGAFFGSIDETGTYAYSTGSTPRPAMRLPTPEQQSELSRLAAAIESAQSALKAAQHASNEPCREWIAGNPEPEPLKPVKSYPLDGDIEGPSGRATALDGDTGPSFNDVPPFRRYDPFSLVLWMRCPDTKSRATVIHTSSFTIESDQQGYQIMLKDGRLCWEIIHLWPGSAAAVRTADPFPLGRWVQVAVTYDGSSRAAGLSIYLDGKPAQVQIVRDHLDGPATVRSFQIGFRDRDVGFKGGAVDDLRVFDAALTDIEAAELHRPGALAKAVETPASNTPDQSVVNFYAARADPACAAATKALREARAAHHALLESLPEIMVMEETAHPRPAHVLSRGQYDQPDLSQPVAADRAIDALMPFDPSWPRDRLGLARWTTDPRNPLTARVAVNRLWAMCFGRGLVATVENFGMQSEPPIYRELLDTLAADFIAGGWDVKAMLRRIVLSATFRQSSVSNPRGMTRDPQNLLLWRGPNSRLSAEMLRDQALAASGLLVEKLGGPSVKPYQPSGLWEEAGASSQGGYVADTGEGAHRRSLYTYRKRTAPPPNMLAFDAGSREQCQARRLPTNTPLQALVLMNDPVFVECARALAARVSADSQDPQDRIARAFRLLAAREPRAAEAAALNGLYERLLKQYPAESAAAVAVAGSKAADPSLAALTLVCSTVMASDAAVTCR